MSQEQLKALIIRLDKKKPDVGDVVAIARAEGRKLFHRGEHIRVISVDYKGDSIGWSVVIGCSDASV